MARGAGPLQLVLPGEAASVSDARRAVSLRLREWDLDRLIDDVALAASELATNAVLHAQGEIRLGLRRADPGVRLEVGDDSRRLPQQRRHSQVSGTGRGLHLVAWLASDWGVIAPSGHGKLIWAVFDAQDAPQPCRRS